MIDLCLCSGLLAQRPGLEPFLCGTVPPGLIMHMNRVQQSALF